MPDWPRLMLGTSPFIGAGQFGSKSLNYRRQFFDTPDNMTRLFVHSAKLGIKAVQLVGYQPLVAALRKAEEITGMSLFQCMLSFVMGLMIG